jgi:hypothetical protein
MEDNDFLEEDENIFSDDEVLDYIIYEEAEKELEKKKNNAGCLSTIILTLSTLSGFAILILWTVG